MATTIVCSSHYTKKIQHTKQGITNTLAHTCGPVGSTEQKLEPRKHSSNTRWHVPNSPQARRMANAFLQQAAYFFLYKPRGPSNQFLRPLAPKTIPLMVSGTKDLHAMIPLAKLIKSLPYSKHREDTMISMPDRANSANSFSVIRNMPRMGNV